MLRYKILTGNLVDIQCMLLLELYRLWVIKVAVVDSNIKQTIPTVLANLEVCEFDVGSPALTACLRILQRA